MDDEEDIKKITKVLNYTKEENLREFEYEEFINYEGSDVDDEVELIEIEEAINDDDYIFSDFSSTDISKLHTYDPRSTLKPEERIVIDSCSDPALKDLLLLNRTKNMQLIQLYKQMKDLLIECQKNISEKGEILKAYTEANKGQTNSTGAWRLAAPYFKDKQLYCSPPNADVLRKRSNNELCIYDLSSSGKWSSYECEKLIRAVKLNYNINQQNAVMQKIQEIPSSSSENRKEYLKELEDRMKELRTNDNSEIPPLNSNNYIDWLRVADVFLRDRHSAFECKSFWHIYLHPHINKSPWTPAENVQLKELVKKYNYQNWDQIAEELDTNRTGFTVCLYYYGNLHEKFKRGEFTFEEDARLLDLVYQYRMGNYIPWVKIVQHFKDRTRSQLHYRYTYFLSQNNKKKGKFSEAEDVLLMILVDKFGKNFRKCSEYLPTRSMIQCKSRYNSNLQRSLKKGSFSIEEDEIIMKYTEEHGSKSWTGLTKKLQRSRGQIRQRYQTIKQFLDCNPEIQSIAFVPRRRHNLKTEEEVFYSLRVIADQYRDNPVIPSLEEIQGILKSKNRNIKKKCQNVYDENVLDENEEYLETMEQVPFPVSNVSIDDMLTDFFCNSYKLNPPKNITPTNVQKAVADVERVLNALKVDLYIPENFYEDYKLDILDVAIINSFIEEKSRGPGGTTLIYKARSNDIDLIPPNMNTVIGLRSLLIKFSHYRSDENQEMMKFVSGVRKQHCVSGIRSNIINHVLSLPSDIRKTVENERKLFYRRFYALFKWPAIMTLEFPSAELQSTSRSTNNMSPIQVKRTYSRANRNQTVDNSEKRLKITELPKTQPKAVPLKLTPVTNKSVIEDLMRNKNKKLFCLNNIKCGDVTKTVIKEVPLTIVNKNLTLRKTNNSLENNSCTRLPESKASTSNQASCSSRESFRFISGQGECSVTDIDDGESIVSNGDNSIEDDEADVKKLDIFLSVHHEEGDTDLEDLRKLDMFLKKENEADVDTDDQSSLCE